MKTIAIDKVSKVKLDKIFLLNFIKDVHLFFHTQKNKNYLRGYFSLIDPLIYCQKGD